MRRVGLLFVVLIFAAAEASSEWSFTEPGSYRVPGHGYLVVAYDDFEDETTLTLHLNDLPNRLKEKRVTEKRDCDRFRTPECFLDMSFEVKRGFPDKNAIVSITHITHGRDWQPCGMSRRIHRPSGVACGRRTTSPVR